MSYELKFSKKAEKQLIKLDKTISKQIFKKLKELEKNPLLGKPLHKNLKNQRSIHTGKYRTLYSIEENRILIFKIKHRKNVYTD